jgi:hypothetical protein
MARGHTRRNTFISKCHPRVDHHTKSRSETCLPSDTLDEVGKSLGAPQTLKGIALRHWMTRRTRCKSERCWVEKASMDGGRKNKLVKTYFRPTMPDSWENDPDEWLDSNNIADVIKQYEEVYPEFKFFGTNPIDFAAPDPYTEGSAEKGKCLEEAICKLKLKDLEAQGKTKLGFVYNLDPSNKGGSHWIASFTDIPGKRTYYFDSYGIKPPPEIARFMRSLTLQDPNMKLSYNSRRFQFGNSECGMYSLYFLICMLEGEPFKKFCRRAPRDSVMLELRRVLFSPKNA